MKKYYDQSVQLQPSSNTCFNECNCNNTYTSKSKKNYDIWSKSVACNNNNSCNECNYKSSCDNKNNINNCQSLNECNSCNLDNYSCLEVCDLNKLYNYKIGKEVVTLYNTPVSEFTLESEDCEVRVDLNINKNKSIVLCGEVRDKCEEPASNVLVTLLKPVYLRGTLQYIKECSTLTNCIGYYQFKLDYSDKETCYKILLGNKCE